MSSKSGKIILLNGVSSAGKSAILNEIHKIDKNVKILKIDDWFPGTLSKKAASLGWKKGSNVSPWFYLCHYAHKRTGQYLFDTQVRELLFDESAEFYQKAKQAVHNGCNVIIDTVLEYEKEYKSFDNFFNNDKILKVLIYCPMNILLDRVMQRNNSGTPAEYRTAFQSFEQFPAMYKVQQSKSEAIVDNIKSSVLLQSLEKAIQDLIDRKIPEPYLSKLQQFKMDFIKQFKLEEQEEIVLVAKHHYDLILNSFINNPTESARKIIKFLEY